ncbi:hypothetical protein P9209_03400 [Prescottella defluvii]|nr:hypothetical protein P9209_03400 [Prescottella defluvii]
MTTPAHQPASGERRRTAAAIKAQIIARRSGQKGSTQMTRSSTSTIYSGQGASATVNNVLAQPDVIAAVVGDNLATSVTSAVFGDATSQAVGGAILYQTVHPGDEFTDGDISARAEGAEYQLVRLPEPDVRRDPVEDLGGKFICTEEAVTRNVLPVLTNGITQVSASIRRAIDGRTIDTLEAAVAEYNLELPGHNWSSYIGGGASPTPNAQSPLADLVQTQLSFDVDGMGAVTSTLIVHPNRPPPCASPTAPTSPTSSTPPAVSPSTPRPTSALATPTSSPDSPAASESRPHSRCR